MKFVVRIVDDAQVLLGWTSVTEVKSDRGLIRSAVPIMLTVERFGVATGVSVHWTDLGVARFQKITPITLKAGLSVSWSEPLWQVVGEENVPLPPVTVRSSLMLSPEVTALGIKSA